MPESLTTLAALTLAETAAIHWLSDPKDGVLKAAGAAGSANILAMLVMALTHPLIAENWAFALPNAAHETLPTVTAIMAWFCAFTLSNATELATLKWMWRVGLTTRLGVVISISNAFSAFQEIQKLMAPN